MSDIWAQYTPEEKTTQIKRIMMRDKLRGLLSKLVESLQFADENAGEIHVSIANDLVTIRKILNKDLQYMTEQVVAGAQSK